MGSTAAAVASVLLVRALLRLFLVWALWQQHPFARHKTATQTQPRSRSCSLSCRTTCVVLCCDKKQLCFVSCSCTPLDRGGVLWLSGTATEWQRHAWCAVHAICGVTCHQRVRVAYLLLLRVVCFVHLRLFATVGAARRLNSAVWSGHSSHHSRAVRRGEGIASKGVAAMCVCCWVLSAVNFRCVQSVS